MPPSRGPRYNAPHDRGPSVRGGAGRRRRAPPRRSRRRERPASAAAHRRATKDRGAGPVGTVAALHDGARSTHGAGVARRHVARPAGDNPPLAPGRMSRVLAPTLSAVGSTPYSACGAHPRDGHRQSRWGAERYIIALAKLAGVKTLNVVRREDAAEQVRQWGGDRVVQQGDNLHKDIEEALNGKKLSLVLDNVGGTPVGELAKSLKTGGSTVVYAVLSGQFPAISPKDLIYRDLSLHGFWLMNWIRNAPRTEIQEIYQKLGDLAADGSLYAAVEHVYPLEQFKEAFTRSLRSHRGGKILFQFGH